MDTKNIIRYACSQFKLNEVSIYTQLYFQVFHLGIISTKWRPPLIDVPFLFTTIICYIVGHCGVENIIQYLGHLTISFFAFFQNARS